MNAANRLVLVSIVLVSNGLKVPLSGSVCGAGGNCESGDRTVARQSSEGIIARLWRA